MMFGFLKATVVAVTISLSVGLAGVPGAIAAEIVVGEEHCVVGIASGDALNLRDRPSVSGDIETRLRPQSCGVMVTDPCQSGWCPVEEGHFAGWVSQRYLAPVSPSLYCVTGVSNSDRLNLRASPSVQARVLTRLAPNACDIAFLPFATGSWQKVRVGGWEGWANRRFLSGQ